MAKRVRTSFRKIKDIRPDLYYELAKSRGMTSTGIYNRLKRKRIKKMIPISKIRKMAHAASKKSGIPMKITQDMEGCRYADGVAVRDNGKVEARLHPVLSYYDKRYVKDVIDHEIDHAKVMRGKRG